MQMRLNVLWYVPWLIWNNEIDKDRKNGTIHSTGNETIEENKTKNRAIRSEGWGREIDNAKREETKPKNRRLISIYVMFRVVHWNAFIREGGERRESISMNHPRHLRFILNDVKLMCCWHENIAFRTRSWQNRTNKCYNVIFFSFVRFTLYLCLPPSPAPFPGDGAFDLWVWWSSACAHCLLSIIRVWMTEPVFAYVLAIQRISLSIVRFNEPLTTITQKIPTTVDGLTWSQNFYSTICCSFQPHFN